MESKKAFIISLVSELYNCYSFLRVEPLDVFLDRILSKYQHTNLSREEIEDEIFKMIIKRKKELDLKYDPEIVKNNHELVYSKLIEIVHLFNKHKIDYQLCGALSGYIKYNVESDRVHDNIDFNINEKDIYKLKDICTNLGYIFEDNRLRSQRKIKNMIPYCEHEIVIKDTNSDFYIGVFSFERLPDHSVINKFYYTNEQGNACVREEFYSPELAKDIFPKEAVIFHGEKIFIAPPEFVYSLKEFTKSSKDLHDIDFFKDKIDKNRYKSIKKKIGLGKIIRFISVDEIKSFESYNPFNELPLKEETEMIAPGIEPKHKDEVFDDTGHSNFLIILLLTMVCLGFLVMSIIITRTFG